MQLDKFDGCFWQENSATEFGGRDESGTFSGER
jgi:hypothetical protein